jgi:NADH-ubiquinone oxidoreductase chain 2
MPTIFFPRAIFLAVTALGTMLALTASNWIYIYAGIELNIFAFIPLIIQTNTNKEHESAIKYLLVQVFGSIALLFAALWAFTYTSSPMPEWLLLIGLLTKAGAAPAHAWFPIVISGLPWRTCFLLSTWQKIFPLLFLFFNLSQINIFPYLLLFSLSCLVGAIGGLNQSSLRTLLAYSSITHMGCIITLSLISPSSALIYLSIYLLNSSLIIVLFIFIKTPPYDNIVLFTPLSYPYKTILVILFLSMAGIPPFLGFFPKWTLLESCSAAFPWVAITILLSSAISTYFYLKITFLLCLQPQLNKINPTPSSYPTILIIFSFSNFFLFIPLLIF